jgi:hypothetical protein
MVNSQQLAAAWTKGQENEKTKIEIRNKVYLVA